MQDNGTNHITAFGDPWARDVSGFDMSHLLRSPKTEPAASPRYPCSQILLPTVQATFPTCVPAQTINSKVSRARCRASHSASEGLQVQICGNAALAAELDERMSQPSSRLGLRFGRTKLLHLLQPNVILDRIQQDPGLLFQICWKHLATKQPGISVLLIQQALETADSHVALKKRWHLVSFCEESGWKG